MDYLPFIIIGIIVVVVVVLIYVGYLMEKKRTEAFKQAAEELGFDFLPKGDGRLMGELGRFHLFSQGHSRRLYNLLRGEASGLEVAIFDYSYTVGAGKHQQTWNQTVVCFHLPDADLPQFSLRPESIWHKIGQWFGYQDINFDSHPAFSKNYLLRGGDEEAIRELFTPDVLEFYEGQTGLSTEGGGSRLLYYRHGKRGDPKDARSLLEQGFKVLALFSPPAQEGE
jgi:hypothetical protein